MSEVLVIIDNCVMDVLVNLYCVWVMGGIGLLIIGNVMVDWFVLGELNNLVIEDECDLLWLIWWV